MVLAFRVRVQLRVGLVGLDMVLLVMGTDLVSFKIVDAALVAEIAPAAASAPAQAAALPSDGRPASAVTFGLTVEDMSLRDMQASHHAHACANQNSSFGFSCIFCLRAYFGFLGSCPPSTECIQNRNTVWLHV